MRQIRRASILVAAAIATAGLSGATAAFSGTPAVFSGAPAAFSGAPAGAAASATPVFERSWAHVTGSPQPPPRSGASIAYDPVRRRTVLFGGFANGQFLGDTWLFDAATGRWTKAAPATSPSPRSGASATFDPATGTVVLFSGFDASTQLGCAPRDTWEWDGSNWTQRNTAHAPGECMGSTMAYDAPRHRVVLYGGLGEGPGQDATTWTWNGNDWTQLHPAHDPGERGGAAMAYDPVSRRVLLFGGGFFFHGNHVFGDTWAWNGSDWREVSGGSGKFDPPRRSSAVMAYNDVLRSMILFGGFDDEFGPTKHFTDTWRWIGTRWVQMGTRISPPASSGAITDDTANHVDVLVGASGTWLLTHAHAGGGMLIAASDGGVFTLGDARFFGSMGGTRLNQPVVGIARTPTRAGYWLAASDGGIFTFGNARFYGSTGAMHLNQPVVGIAATPSGKGYWLVARDGGIFTFGNARFYGSTGGIRLNQPIVAMAATPTGAGYWLLARDGGIFTFGDARFFGSAAGRAGRTFVAIATAPRGDGYWLASPEGPISTFGAARFAGAGSGGAPQTAIVASPTGVGYWTVYADGSTGSFGVTPPGLIGAHLGAPVVGAVST